MDTFILHGINFNEINKPKISRFKAAQKKKTNIKVTSFVNKNGQKVKINYIQNVTFNDANLKQIQCWWDRNIIDDIVMTLPNNIKYDNGQYLIYGDGAFCSDSCMLAYILNEQKKQPEHRDIRYKNILGNIYQLHDILYPDDISELKPANDWRVLESAGGDISIQDYRYVVLNKTYTRTPNIKFNITQTGYLIE